jgi:hypothetical protein
MMAMTIEKPTSKWRNFAIWSAVGAVYYVLIVSGISLLLNGEGPIAIARSEVAAVVGGALIFSAASVGFSMRNSPINPRRVRNFLISSCVALAVFLLGAWSFSQLVDPGIRDALEVSEWVAAMLGFLLIFFALMGSLALASVRSGADFIENEEAAEQLRERGRLHLYSLAWMLACGLSLIGLSLAGSGSLLSPAPALAGVLLLIAVAIALSVAVWQIMDELDRTLSQEAGNIAFYLILLAGGGWAMLAHLGFVPGPAPLDWLTMFTVTMFAAAIIAAGRRKLLNG